MLKQVAYLCRIDWSENEDISRRRGRAGQKNAMTLKEMKSNEELNTRVKPVHVELPITMLCDNLTPSPTVANSISN